MSSYTPTDWVDGTTPVNAANLDKMEAGILAAGGGVVNVLDHGAVADDATDNTAAFAAALAALPALGGALVVPPGIYRGRFDISANKQTRISGYGVTLKPPVGQPGVYIHQGGGGDIFSTLVEGLYIDGAALGASHGVKIQDTDRARLHDLNVYGAGIGVELAATATGWVEGTRMMGLALRYCSTHGIKLTQAAADRSFGESTILDCLIQSCPIGFEIDGVFYRCFVGALAILQSNGHKGILLKGNPLGSLIQAGIESFGDGTGQVGVDVTSTAWNPDKADFNLAFTGSFATKVQIAVGKDFNWRQGPEIRMDGSGTGGRALRAFQGQSEAYPRVEIGGGFAGGGGVLLGPGGGAPDVQLYRNGVGQLETNVAFKALGGVIGGGADLSFDGDYAAGTYQDGDIVVKDGIAYLCVGGPTTVAPDPSLWGAASLVTPPYMTLISEQILVAAAATITFLTIPGTFRELRLFGILRGDTAAAKVDANVRFNGDAGANYHRTEDHGYGTFGMGGLAQDGQTSAFLGVVPAASSTAGWAGVLDYLIPYYAQTTFWKGIIGHTVGMNNNDGTPSLASSGGQWKNTAAITQIAVIPSAGNWLAGSRLALYGVA